MILDNALEKTLILPKDLRKLLLNEKPITHRYVFNEDASHKMGHFMTTCPDIICREATLTNMPFPDTYIEIDCQAAIKGTGDRLEHDAAPRLGFWFVKELCFSVYGDEEYAEFSPFMFTPTYATRPITDFFTDEKSISGYKFLKELLMLGNIRKEFDRDKLAHMLTSQFELKYITNVLSRIKNATEEKVAEVFEAFVQNDIGLFKKALACLLLLDARSQRRTVSISATRRIVKGKLRAYAAHDVITIDLDVPSIRTVYNSHVGHHATPIEHEVAGHWVHYDCSSQCQHHWIPLHSERGEKLDMKKHGELLPRFICSLCGGRKTRKLPHVKGDPSKGSRVGHTRYKVIASKEKSVLWKPGKPDDPE